MLALFQQEHEGTTNSARSDTVHMFIHSAISALFASLHHLVSGHPIAAAHMMRHFFESAAMALLCADQRIDVFVRYAMNPDSYPVDQAPARVARKDVGKILKAAIGFDRDGWVKNLDMGKLADRLSHTSYLALGHQVLFDQNYDFVIGSHFDTGKLTIYQADLSRLESAASAFREAIPLLMAHAREPVASSYVEPSVKSLRKK